MAFSANELKGTIEKGIARSQRQVTYIPRQLAISLKKSVMLSMDASRAEGGAKAISAVAFSGGLDSSIIAKVASEKDPSTPLISFGTKDSRDLEVARSVAREMGAANFVELVVDDAQVLSALDQCRKLHAGTFLELELMACAHMVCTAAKQTEATQILFGSGAEELFAGYERHYDKYEQGEDLFAVLQGELRALPGKDLALTAKVAAHLGLDVSFPFIDEEVITIAFGCVPEEKIYERQMKKPQLREAAKKLNVPHQAVNRPKLAMQYGSGIHKILSKKYNDDPTYFKDSDRKQ